ncbi:MAG: HPF/RaiA family ribosome-associated protein [Gammaproteobacteria bacterium]|nr:HPF/RaiA family ribosome-associated protein [Gammaproteobacteria bacterium]MDH5592229.1 HPF/RaiA family ribosome-associated protein [Gammaproteobacteria bacterium]
MQIPLQITFKDMDHSDALEAKIREKAEKLEQFSQQIMSCRVVVEEPHKHHHQGNLFSIKIDVTLPGHEIVANKQSDQDHSHEDAYVAIRDAFDAVRRQIQDRVSKRRGDVKVHEIAPHGRIKALYPEMDYGLIETIDGREIYFHRNSLINFNFDDLEVGNKAHFSEEAGNEGPQASSVHIEGK